MEPVQEGEIEYRIATKEDVDVIAYQMASDFFRREPVVSKVEGIVLPDDVLPFTTMAGKVILNEELSLKAIHVPTGKAIGFRNAYSITEDSDPMKEAIKDNWPSLHPMVQALLQMLEMEEKCAPQLLKRNNLKRVIQCFGLLVLEEYEGRGIGTRKSGFEGAKATAANPRSRRIFEKEGFENVGHYFPSQVMTEDGSKLMPSLPEDTKVIVYLKKF
ncbi:unnamed protein product [Darwinula stevensoni]|uniref:N-acetyltransferase domain-containing protein n=1 Tax=Darwinula stevensoni TaxID=69355 RepID=A0A7R9FQU8_9CRUS|nr:unnamed protein product [Darwinula stevensoni]CAG0900433.1 unnamed protein product [Darwinula stevensoni]